MPYWDHDKSRRDSASAFIVAPWAYYSLRGVPLKLPELAFGSEKVIA